MAKTLSRKERESLRHREEIQAVAVRLFSENGFHKVSMQDIAKESEFAVGTLYNFFQSKEQLFTELMKAGIENVYKLLVPILDSDAEEDKKLSEFIEAHVDLVESNLQLTKLFISQYGTSASIKLMLKDISLDLKNVIARKLERIIRTGVQKHIFRHVHPETVALSLRATMEAFVLDASEHFDKAKTKDGLSQIEAFFLCSLLYKEAP